MNLKEKKRLLFVISALEAGGAEKSLINLLNLIDYDRYSVDLLLFKKKGVFINQIPPTVRVIDAPDDLYFLFNINGRGIKRAVSSFSSVLARVVGTAYRNIIIKNKSYPGTQIRWNKFYKKRISALKDEYDVAISYMHGEVMYYVAEKVNANKKITWVHNDYKATKLKPQLDLPYFKAFDQIATISRECVDIFVQVFPQLKSRTVCIPNLTSSKLIRNLANAYYPQEYKDCSDSGKRIILSIGRLSYQKGFDIAVEIASELKQRGLAFVWYILGQGEEQKNLIDLVKRYDVENEIVFLGVRENPYPYIRFADIIAQPSRFEGKSVVLDEAKILCKPIVVSDYATVLDQIKSEQEGIVVKLDVEDFSTALESLIKSEDKRRKLEGYLEQHEYGNEDSIALYYKIME